MQKKGIFNDDTANLCTEFLLNALLRLRLTSGVIFYLIRNTLY